METLFCKILLGFTPYWDYIPTNAIHADSPGVYIIDKNVNLDKIGFIRLKFDVRDGSRLSGVREPVLLSFFYINQAVIKHFSKMKQYVIKH